MQWLWQFDLNAFRAIHVGCHRTWLDPIFLAITYTGLGQVQVAGALLLLIRRATRRFVLPILIAFASSGLVNDAIKMAVPRDRPSNLSFAMPQEPHLYSSFPSGHSVTSFAIAFLLLIALRGTTKAWVGWTALLWACLVGFSRIYRGVHWPTDVLGAAALGLVCACIVSILLPVRPPEPG